MFGVKVSSWRTRRAFVPRLTGKDAGAGAEFEKGHAVVALGARESRLSSRRCKSSILNNYGCVPDARAMQRDESTAEGTTTRVR